MAAPLKAPIAYAKGHFPHSPTSASTTAPPTSTSASSAIPVEALLTKKLKEPSAKLSSTESIALLTHCIQLGKLEAEKARGKDLIVFIGNTGAGKSTFVNYLYGCTMQRVQPQSLGLEGTGRIVVVKPPAQGGAAPEIMKIGHTNASETFMPQIVTDSQNFTYCDCPGFLDNRGTEINIANAANIRNAFVLAKSVKVVILINYHSLKAEKARGLKETIGICCSLFGTRENLTKYKDSILLGLTQTPFQSVSEDGEPPEVYQLEDLKKWMVNEKGLELLNDFDKTALNQLAQQLFNYDPCESTKLMYQGALKRGQVLTALGNLTPITSPLDIFKTVLTPTDLQGLVTITNDIKAAIQTLFSKPHLSSDDFKQIAYFQESLNQLEVIEHPYVAKLTAETRHVITEYFQKLVHQFELQCLGANADMSTEAEGILKIIKEGIQHFDQQIQNQVDTKELDERYSKLILKQSARKEIEKLGDLEKDLRTCCAYDDFKRAKALLTEIETAVQNFATHFAQSGEKHKVKIDELRNLYERAKENYDANKDKQKAQQARLDELEKKLAQERKERELQAKAQQEKQAKEKQDADSVFQRLQNEIAQKAKRDLEAQAQQLKQAQLQQQALIPKQPNLPVNYTMNKHALRNQLLGNGPVRLVGTPMGPHLSTSNGQLLPVDPVTLSFGQVVFQFHQAGCFHLDQTASQVTPVMSTPNGYVPRP